MMMYRFLILLTSMFICANLYAQPRLTDTIPTNSHQLEICSFLSSLEELPVDSLRPELDDFYSSNWNSTQIRYSQQILPPKEDTVVMTLVGPYQNSFVMPVRGKVISKFGRRGGRQHTGTDIKLNSGDPVVSAFDGRVRIAKRFSGYGNVVVVRHTNGLETVYAHLKAIRVTVDDTLRAGDLVGLGGRTGRATCDHLHFETRFLGEPFDSGKYIDFETGALTSEKIYYQDRQIETSPAYFRSRSKTQPPMLASAEGASKHVVRRGDNLWLIAKKYQTTVKKLCAFNNIPSNKILKIGEVLHVN